MIQTPKISSNSNKINLRMENEHSWTGGRMSDILPEETPLPAEVMNQDEIFNILRERNGNINDMQIKSTNDNGIYYTVTTQHLNKPHM